ncbi:MAG: hypothetical protein KDA28_03910, partial [Phycisphaerales bacterium]|nr:hypothetical protein [Phycisphaerales bacterium]
DTPGASFDATFSDLQGWTPDLGGDGNLGDDPDFVDPAGADGLPGTIDDDLHLARFSPCIDAGNNLLVPEDIRFDLDLDPRFLDDPEVDDTGVGTPPVTDIGADERRPEAACAVDLNGDGLVDVFDILEFLEAFEKQNPAADWNGDTVLDIFDVTAFLGDFTVGCT